MKPAPGPEAAEQLLAQLLRARWTGEAVAASAETVQPQIFRAAVRLHGVAGVLECRHRAQLQQLPPALAEGVSAERRRHVVRSLGQVRACLEAVAALERAGIASLPLKGVALSWRLYGDIGIRQSGDVDLLVDPDEVIAAVPILQALGYQPVLPLPQNRLHWRARMRDVHHVNFTHARGQYLELHWRTDPMRSTSLPRLAALLPRLERIAGGPLRGLYQLPPDLLLRSLASHACRSRCARWKWGYDLLDILSAGHGGASPWDLQVVAAQDAYTRHTLASMAAQLGLGPQRPSPAIALACRAAAVERGQLLGGAPRRFSDGSLLHAAAWAALDGWPARLEYLGWISTRTSPEIGDRAYTLVARAPWLGPLARLAHWLRKP